MANKKDFFGMFVVALALGLVLLGCPTEEDNSPKKYQVTFDLNGGTLTSGTLTQEVEDGKTASVPTVTPPAGKEADGWTSSEAKIASTASPITADVTFTAKWKDKAPASDAPTVTVTSGDGKLDISWTAVAGETGGYKVYIRNTDQNPTEANLAKQTATGVLNYTTKNPLESGMNIANGIKYYVWVRAIKASGDSDLSVVKEGTPKAADSKPEKPAAPKVTALPSGQLKIEWTAVASATKYDVVVLTSDGSPASTDLFVGDSADKKLDHTEESLEFTTTKLSSSKTYHVFVRAKNAIGAGSWSDIVSRTTVDPVESVVGKWPGHGGIVDSLLLTAPDTCVRTYQPAGATNTTTVNYTYVYTAATGELALTPAGGGAAIYGTVTGNVLKITFGGVLITYTKE